MKNYPIIKSNEAVTVLFTAPRHGYVLDYSDDHYEDVLYKSDWAEGAFSVVNKSWFKGKYVVVNNVTQNEFVLKLIHNHSSVVFPDAGRARMFYLDSENQWVCSNRYDHKPDECDQCLYIPFDEIFNDTTVTTELKGTSCAPAPAAAPPQHDYESIVNSMVGIYNLNTTAVIGTDELLDVFKRLVTKPNTPKYNYEYIVNHVLKLLNSVKVGEVNIGNLYDTINNLLTDVVDKQTPVAPAPTTMLEASNVMSLLAKHLNKPIGVSDIEPAIKELISTKPSNPKLIELVESFRSERDSLCVAAINYCHKDVVKTLNAATDLCNELVNAAMFNGVTTETPVTPPIEWREMHEVKLNNTWWQVEPVFVSEVEMFFYDPRPVSSTLVLSTGVRNANLSVVNLKSPDYRNNEVGYLCIDDDGVLHPYDPESQMTEIKLCKNIL